MPIASFFTVSRKMGREVAAAVKRELAGENKGRFVTVEIPPHLVDVLRESFLAKEGELAQGGAVTGRDVSVTAGKSVHWVTGGKTRCAVRYAFHGLAENREPFSGKVRERRLVIRYAQNKPHGNWILSEARWL